MVNITVRDSGEPTVRFFFLLYKYISYFCLSLSTIGLPNFYIINQVDELKLSTTYLIGLSHYDELHNVWITNANLEDLGAHWGVISKIY